MSVKKVALPPVDKNVLSQAWGFVSTIMTGMRLTLTIFFKQLLKLEKSETLEWPEAPATYGDRFKGRHFLTRREDGQVRCTACYLCATACPAECIHIEAGQHPSNEIEKFPVRFEIDILRCVFCGMCEEACPVDAIRLGPEFAMVGGPGENWVYTKDYLAARPELNSGISSIKSENNKHSTIDHEPTAKERKTELHFGAGH